MRIAIEGCAHGELQKIYATIAELEASGGGDKVDLLLCCGDFQATRNTGDLNCMAIPRKFHDMCSFHKYYSGQLVAPILTIFIGGNHEASNYMQELPYGGWVAPNIYYLGYAGVVRVNGVRIAGLSGIYKGYNYHKGHFEVAPYDENAKKSAYHVRQLDVYRLQQLSGHLDVCLSHDWPRGVYNFGDSEQLCRFKPHFRDEIADNRLGSPPAEELLQRLRPDHWFAAHLHCKFAAVVPHRGARTSTKFLALDKCLPQRRFLQLLDIGQADGQDDTNDGPQSAPVLSYDLEWLTILHRTNHLLHIKTTSQYMPGPGGTERHDFTPTEAERDLVLRKMGGDLVVPVNFQRTAPPYDPSAAGGQSNHQPSAQLNPQTTEFCERLCLDDPVALLMVMMGKPLQHATYVDPEPVVTEVPDVATDASVASTSPVIVTRERTAFNLPEPQLDNPDHLQLDEDDDAEEAEAATEAPQTAVGAAEAVEATADVADVAQSKESIVVTDLIIESPAAAPVDAVEDSVVPPKKFKRRNEAIYGAPVDE